MCDEHNTRAAAADLDPLRVLDNGVLAHQQRHAIGLTVRPLQCNDLVPARQPRRQV